MDPLLPHVWSLAQKNRRNEHKNMDTIPIVYILYFEWPVVLCPHTTIVTFMVPLNNHLKMLNNKMHLNKTQNSRWRVGCDGQVTSPKVWDPQLLCYRLGQRSLYTWDYPFSCLKIVVNTFVILPMWQVLF